MAPSRGRKWQTPEGHAIIRQVVKEKIPEWTGGLHDWQVIVVTWILDGEDALCITATGDGKSAIFAVPIIVLLEVAQNPTKYRGFAVNQKKAVGIVIVPTKGLAANIGHELSLLRVPALACTSETLTEARKSGRDLTAEIAECRWPIVCIDPEHLTDKQWECITNSQVFHENIVFACIDEGHLIVEWGLEFRPAFNHIGTFCRGRLPPHISVFALTATLQPGSMTKAVCRSLGFQPRMFHLLRRSNEHINVQFLLAPLTRGLGGAEFPDLLQYLIEGRKTIIYCATIELCWRVFVYLFRRLPRGLQRLRVVRLYHAICWPEENEETVALLRDDPLCQVVVATVAFGQGFNVKSLLDSISLGVPKTVAQTLQQGGRVARDPATTGRAVVLAQASAYSAAEKYLKAQSAGSRQSKAKTTSKSLTTMNNEKALMLTTKGCLIAFFNKLYGNNTPRALLDCIAVPRCLPCSNCLLRFVGPLYLPNPSCFAPFVTPPSISTHTPTCHTPQKLTRKMRATAEAQLRRFRDHIYSLERDRDSHGYTPLSAYFSNPTIASVLDSFLQISTLAILSTTIPQWKYHSRHGESLLALIGDLQHEFTKEFEAARLERNKKNRLRGKSKRTAAAPESEDDQEMEVEEEEIEEPPVAPPRPMPRRIEKRALDDITNAPRAKRQALEAAAVVAASYGPQYKTSRRRNTENS
ncbi:P-loop containing nucleoside triphosphate hydrolase protein [Mycena maculata]|uniref:DNA 3'-5' helicase n=1 Tax=Mycena maculata TaxID=230809 RepID=A0AAD7JNL8_9AGAR|nr:P-loop containing nucleoside triphosphate hydrolase protein [Mycena maculata]